MYRGVSGLRTQETQVVCSRSERNPVSAGVPVSEQNMGALKWQVLQ